MKTYTMLFAKEWGIIKAIESIFLTSVFSECFLNLYNLVPIFSPGITGGKILGAHSGSQFMPQWSHCTEYSICRLLDVIAIIFYIDWAISS